MWKRWPVELMLIAGLFLMSACSLMDMGRTNQVRAVPPTAPPPPPRPAVQSPPAQPSASDRVVLSGDALTALPGDQGRLQAALRISEGTVKYRVVLAKGQIADKTAYLDTLGEPAQNEFLVVLFPDEGYDMRFALGQIFWSNDINVDVMLGWMREQYLPPAREGNPATGLAALIESINKRLAL